MLAPPSLFDRVIGNLPVFLLLWGSFAVTAYLWYVGAAPNQYAPFVLAFLAFLSRASRARLVADARWQADKAEATGKSRPGMSLLQVVFLAPFWALFLVVAFFFVAGGLHIDEGQLVTDARAAIAAALSHPGMKLAALVSLVVGVALVGRRIGLGLRRVAGIGDRRGTPVRGWKGTVRVMLPVPKDDR